MGQSVQLWGALGTLVLLGLLALLATYRGTHGQQDRRRWWMKQGDWRSSSAQPVQPAGYHPQSDSADGGALARTIEHELVPRLLLAHRAGPLSPVARLALAEARERAISPEDRERFLAAVLVSDEQAASVLASSLVDRGVEVQALMIDLLAPTAVRLGELWESDECDFFQVTVAMGRMERLLRELSGLLDNARHTVQTVGPGGATESITVRPGRVLLAPAPGEQHTLGLYIVAEMLLRDGWGVMLGGSDSGELLAAMSDEWVDVVGFTVGSDVPLLRLRRLIADIRRTARNRNLHVIVGGRAFLENPDLVQRVGADAFATSALDATARVREALTAGPR